MSPALARACHPGPTLAVTALTVLLALTAALGPATAVLVVAAVLTGQLSIGWSNDLVDRHRDRAAGRLDKPLAQDDLSARTVQQALGVVLVATVLLSVAAGWRSGLVHLVLVVGSGWAYNLGLKGTAWSWVPYAAAFGSLPAVVWLAGGAAWSSVPPWWMLVVGALLGVGAHLLNVLPDLADDARTGVRGLPHRLGESWTRTLGPLLLLLGSVVVTLAPSGPVPTVAWAALAACSVLAVMAWTAQGRAPFVAAIGMALIDVAGLSLR